MDLLFCINRSFVPHLGRCARSVLRNGGCAPYHAYVVHSDLTQADQQEIRQSVGEGMDFTFLTVPDELFADFPESERYPRQIYYRLAAPLLLPRELERVLYLDVDTLVINPLTELQEISFGEASFLACSHVQKALSKLNQARLGVDMEKDTPYLNSGVILFCLPRFREELDMGAICEYAKRKKNALFLPDQDILTALYAQRAGLLDPLRYNLSDRVLALHNVNPKREALGVDWVRKNTVILHYCGKNKPWKEGYKGVLDVFYHENP